MGYSTIAEVEAVLGQAMTSASPEVDNGRISLIDIGNTRNFNRIPDDIVNYYINFADSEIDGILSEMYYTPFKKCAHGEWSLEEDINPDLIGDSTTGSGSGPEVAANPANIVVISSAINFVPGDEFIIRNDTTGLESKAFVDEIVDEYTLQTTEDVEGSFLAVDDIRVIRLRFPSPLNQISARMSASFIYDKYFAAQNAPGTSEYGKEMRNIAMGQINNILNGKIIFPNCARRKGNRFASPQLDDTYQHRDRGYNTSERNMSKL